MTEIQEENTNSLYNNENGGNINETNQNDKTIFPKSLYDSNERSINDGRRCQSNVEEIEKNLKELTKMNINDAIDKILVGLSNLVDRKVLKKEDILDNVDLLIALNPENYKKAKVDLIIDNKIDICKKKNFDILHKKVDNTIIQDIENLI